MRSDRPGWPLERVLFVIAGTVTTATAVLAATVSRRFLILTGLVGANQLLFAVTGRCPASILLKRTCALKSPIFDPPANENEPTPAQEVPAR
ncbi:DUF2892 domain-containing protein [Conexibacter sp. DBS9H8]|uniref:YgaP family membrane protein n=1 Tax=Conexibacter sp. DBS9H8 TaxID=2937801 RepID=UPI00200CF8D6|nr:DUF2892 domain-containing protein [Conexibacter sp. DBS9H8]